MIFPPTYGLDLAWKAMPALTLAADLQRIECSDIKSVGAVLNGGGEADIHRYEDVFGPAYGWKF